jgi:hypothetical protein
VLSLATRNAIFQVSDRRLTRIRNGIEVVNEYATKQVVFGGDVVFGYTGVAQIAGRPAERWLAEQLSTSARAETFDETVSRLITAANEAFARIGYPPTQKRQAFQAIGWFRSPAKPQWMPGVVTVENALADDSLTWLPRVRSNFRGTIVRYELLRHRFTIDGIGLPIPAAERYTVWRHLRKCVARKDRQEEAILTGMVDAVRWLNTRHGGQASTIGRNLLATCIPKTCAGRFDDYGEFSAQLGLPNQRSLAFLDLSEGERPKRTSPLFVYGKTIVSMAVTGLAKASAHSS